MFSGVLNKNFWDLSLEGIFQIGRQNSTFCGFMAHRNNYHVLTKNIVSMSHKTSKELKHAI